MPDDKEIKKNSAEKMTSSHSKKLHREGEEDDSLLYSPVRSKIDDLIRQKAVRKLHDGLTQTVSALAMRINFASRMMKSDQEAVEQELEKIETLVRETAREVKHMMFLLNPMQIESQGLFPALESMAEKMEELFNLEIELVINGDFVGILSFEDQLVIYSVVEEAIDSVRKRNRGAHVLVRLDRIDPQVVHLEIEDKGKAAAQDESPFQGQDLESIEKFARLIGGSVGVEKNGLLLRILFPFHSDIEESSSALQ